MLLVLFNPYIGPLSGATTPGKSGPGSNGNEGVVRIPQSSSIAGTSPSDCLVSYPGHSLGGGSYPSAEVQSVYSTAPADWAKFGVEWLEKGWYAVKQPTQNLDKKDEKVGNQRSYKGIPNYSIIDIDLNIKKSQEDLRTLAVFQISVNSHHLTVVGTPHKD